MRALLRGAIGSIVGGLCLSAQGAVPLEMSAFFTSRWTYQPRWSPDGRHVAFMQDDWSRQQLYVAAADGGEPRQLSESERFIGDPRGGSAGQAPTWSPMAGKLCTSRTATSGWRRSQRAAPFA